MVTEEQIRQALTVMEYRKTEQFIHRCKLEVDGIQEIPVSVVKDIAFSMLDTDLEDELMLRLGIYN